MKTPWINFAEMSRPHTRQQTIIVSTTTPLTISGKAEEIVVADELIYENTSVNKQNSPQELPKQQPKMEDRKVIIRKLSALLKAIQLQTPSILDHPPMQVQKNNSSLDLDESYEEAKQLSVQRFIQILKIICANLSDKPMISEQAPKKEMCIEELVHILQQVQKHKHNNHIARFATALKQVQTVLSERPEAVHHDPASLSSFYEEEHADDNVASKDSLLNDERQSYQTGFVYQKTIKTPFSTVIEIDDFHHAPLFPEDMQYTFEWRDNHNGQSPQLETTFVSSTNYYPDLPYCELVCSKIHETIFLSPLNNLKKQNRNLPQSTATPLHAKLPNDQADGGKHPRKSIKIKVPVVIGEYEIETSLTEDVLFEYEPIHLKNISKRVVLTNCQFSPAKFSEPTGKGMRSASKGLLSIEGSILQTIEYTAAADQTNQPSPNDQLFSLHVMMALEIWIQLLQVQGVDVSDHRINDQDG
ncbi:BC_2427 family protein [Sporosarcina sp. HYO08]|uniref:BC_2427 family protein n=1 Tax=Sporosarcina sp. HYO08 TaxID=1759557 RepID=UPI000793460E|nr:hypothetical protein [Sporosarcina sp. HYO08]KXH79759.1 hypothetical protein AU377_09725 [Sporosarcina sp. HYO08]